MEVWFRDPRTFGELRVLAAHDDDPFARYEAMQQLMLDTLVGSVSTGSADHAPVIEAVRQTLSNPDLDPAFIGEAVLLPSEAFIGDQMLVVDPQAIHAARDALRGDLGRELETLWRDAYAASAANRFEYSPAAKGARRLRTVALGYLSAAGAEDAPDRLFIDSSCIKVHRCAGGGKGGPWPMVSAARRADATPSSMPSAMARGVHWSCCLAKGR